MKQLTVLFTCLLLAFPLNAQDVRTLLKENPERLANIHHSYEPPAAIVDTPAPEGYEPFYLSHYGRHGSRYLTSMRSVTRVSTLLDTLGMLGCLTEEGKALRDDLDSLARFHEGQAGNLTTRGGLEHQGISQRMYDRFPSLFHQPVRNRVVAVSSSSQRCIQSLANFTLILSGNAPQLQFTVYDIFYAGNICQCLKLDYDVPDIYRYFTEDELYTLWYVDDIANYNYFANTVENLNRYDITGQRVLVDIVEKADAALAGDDVVANLRFGHDSGLMSLWTFLRMEGCEVPGHMAEGPDLGWYCFLQMPMGSNMQLVFYKNKAGDVIVKILRNEVETVIPSLKPWKGPYYKWKDLRAHFGKLLAIDYTL